MLRYQSDIRTIVFIAGFLALRVWHVAHPEFAHSAALVFLYTFLMLVHFSISHNHIHLPVFTQKHLNRGLDFVLTALVIDPIANLRVIHALNHHVHENQDEDLMNSRVVPEKWKRFALFAYPLFSIRNIAKHKAELWANHHRFSRQKRGELVLVYAMLAGLVYTLGWGYVLLFWVLPSLISRWILSLTNLIQHDGCDTDDIYQSARNFVHPVFNWFFFNSGFHTAHHLRQDLHWSVLPAWHSDHIAPRIHRHLLEPDVFSTIFRFYVLNRRK